MGSLRAARLVWGNALLAGEFGRGGLVSAGRGGAFGLFIGLFGALGGGISCHAGTVVRDAANVRHRSWGGPGMVGGVLMRGPFRWGRRVAGGGSRAGRGQACGRASIP